MSNIQQFDYTINLLRSILWQYDETTKLVGLIENKQIWHTDNQTGFWTSWFDDVFRLTTANDFGISVWAIILGLPEFVPLSIDPLGKPIFGFNENLVFPALLNTYLNFGNSNFSVQGSSLPITLEEKRWLLRLRYFQLICRGAIDDYTTIEAGTLTVNVNLGINNFLRHLSQSSLAPMNGEVWALDGLDMTMTYVFNFNVPEVIRQMVVAYDLMPRPAGVELNYLVLGGPVFGFGASYQNFNNGNFYNPF